MSNVPVEKYTASSPTNMKALPVKVKSRNFMAECSLRPLPQMEMRKNMGMSSSSQKMKKRTKSCAMKTPITAVCSVSSHAKYSRCRVPMLHEL